MELHVHNHLIVWQVRLDLLHAHREVILMEEVFFLMPTATIAQMVTFVVL